MKGFLEDHAPNSEEFKYFRKKEEESREPAAATMLSNRNQESN
jgi:hypothetical protein